MTAVIELNHQGAKAVRSRHPWVYRDHISRGNAQSGELVRVVNQLRQPIGVAAWSEKSKIALRFLTFGPDDAPDDDELRRRFDVVCRRRDALADVTDAVRLVSSEADGFPGLVIDRYRDTAVVTALTPFADRLLHKHLVAWLADHGVAHVIARHDSSMRDKEGLDRGVAVLAGRVDQPIDIVEHEVRFSVDLSEGQKTGHFLDQRRNRARFASMIEDGARVLDAFSYTGGFGLHAARRAGEVVCRDDSERAVAQATANAAKNGFDNVRCERGNAFHVLRDLVKQGERFDAVVLDPPAFARNRGEVGNAMRGYREINRQAFKLVREGGLLVSASCSYQVQEPLFEDMLRRAAADAGRGAVVVERGGQDFDHPVLLSLPQSRYLKCYFLEVTGPDATAPAEPREGTP